MLEFSHDPPLEATRYAMRLLRTPAKGALHLISTADDLLGCWTHYFAGRTTPCTGNDCEACLAGASSRWHAYLCCLDPATHEHLLFECTAAAAEAFAAYRAKNGSLRGCEFLASRVAARPNARVHIRMKPADLTAIDLPAPANVAAILCHLWGIPTTQAHTRPLAQGAQTIHVGPVQLPPDRGNGEQDLTLDPLRSDLKDPPR